MNGCWTASFWRAWISFLLICLFSGCNEKPPSEHLNEVIAFTGSKTDVTATTLISMQYNVSGRKNDRCIGYRIVLHRDALGQISAIKKNKTLLEQGAAHCQMIQAFCKETCIPLEVTADWSEL